MTLVESSPGRDLLDPIWSPKTKHEAPGVEGILSIYNMSDRRRWYWPCLHCGHYFQVIPGIEFFSLFPAYDELIEVVKLERSLQSYCALHSKVVCPDCGGIHEEKDKRILNSRGVWLGEDQWCEDGVVYGEETQSVIAGFWLSGAATPFQEWKSITYNYLIGLKTYLQSGSEEALKTATNVDLGAPYIPRAIYESMGAGDLKNRQEDYKRYFVPDWTRLLLASVDVQGGRNGRFVVQVHAIGEYLRQCVVDRFDIAYAGDDATKRRVNPGAVAEDWDLLIDKVINASYKTSDGRKMLVYMMAIDTGGEGDTTNQSYQFYRRLRQIGLHTKVMLIKGHAPRLSSVPVKQSYGLDSRNKPMKDAPIYLVDTGYFKDIVASMLRKLDYNGIYLHLPKWLHNEFIEELQAEIKDDKGKWVKIRERNEALDLCVYILAICWKLKLNLEGWQWDKAPLWCQTLDTNNHVVSADFAREARSLVKRSPPQKSNQQLSNNNFGGWGSRL
jgi:phage terminase large subunit GpA-like protein